MRHRPEYNPKIIGNNLRRLREANGLSVEYVREYLRLGSVQAVYKYEQGKGYPQTDTMFALMELYGATLSDIIYEPKHVVFDYYMFDEDIYMERSKKNKVEQFQRIEAYYKAIGKGVAG